MAVKETMDVISFVKLLGEKLEGIEADGKVGVFELLAAAPGLLKPAFDAISGAGNVGVEVKSMSREDLEAMLSACFDAAGPWLRMLGMPKAG